MAESEYDCQRSRSEPPSAFHNLQSKGDERARAEALINDLRAAVKDQSTPIDRLRQLTSDLQQVSHSLASAAYSEQANAAAAGAGAVSGSSTGSGGDDDVIDAEYTPK